MRTGIRHRRQADRGMTLVELMLALALSAILLTGLVQVVSGATGSARLQDEQAQLQENARYAIGLLSRHIRQAGFNPEPWNPDRFLGAFTAETADNVSAGGDRLALQSWSDRNCFENLNPVADAGGRPAFFLRRSVFDLNTSKNLAHSCSYGPSAAELTVQIRREGHLPGVESFQLLFGEDRDGDMQVDRWVRAGEWADEMAIRGVRVGMLLSGSAAVLEPETREYRILDTTRRAPADRRLRRAVEFTVASRLQ
ncbi:MAG: PilW family protein [Xanthomonadales bacterium]|nr:PilW family protein [Xanthomonadales bacterium]